MKNIIRILERFLLNLKDFPKNLKYYFKNIANDLGLPIAPMIEENVLLTHELLKKYSSELTSLNNQPFEGVVVKHSKGSFKILNKSYDSKK
jgi:hypothetical protein